MTSESERIKILLDERARVLARPFHDRAPEPALSCVLFSIGRERYAIESAYARAVAKLEHSARLPGAPSFVHGVTHVRGEIIAVLDLGALFDRRLENMYDSAHVLVLGRERDELAILAEDIETTELTIAKLNAPLSPSQAKYVSRVSEHGIALIDGAKLLDELLEEA
jgi:purine-binding chemotaxis protein CheW